MAEIVNLRRARKRRAREERAAESLGRMRAAQGVGADLRAVAKAGREAAGRRLDGVKRDAQECEIPADETGA